ncbi:S-formylglutathione hydrolase [Litorivivens lipolytica]|uniref:S-formylglutathione hydrolase n=1 Tax=Litorivivens lipolytica TaxID=1524264 RepID=A0A7W4Z7A2_9GAMM|nr:S-formylglutathione hydrolase [Litorivivens lipolytica]MBB3047810.1 S-formylglutathione hydrolase [Litorivivens lipolytica]
MEKVSEVRCFDGWQLRYKHRAASLNCVMHFSVYLPPHAETQRVPVLYWLSGLTCTDENFVTKAGAQRYAAEHGIAIVAPDTSPRGDNVPDDPEGAYDFGLGAGFYVNATQPPWSSYYRMYDYIVDELPALVAEHLPVDAGRESVFGHSMGGHGALTIALKNPGRFRSVSAFAPICAPTQCPWGEKAFTGYLGNNREDWQAYDAVELITAGARLPPLKVDQGRSDNFLAEQLHADRLIQACKAKGIAADIQYRDDYDHSYFFIASFIGEHIAFHSAALSAQ